MLIEWLRQAPDETFRESKGRLRRHISGSRRDRGASPGRERSGREVNETLDECFTGSVRGYEYRAGVVKWGGEAVLLLFEGPARRPC